MNKNRVLYYDVLNVLACIAVVAIHHNGIVHTYSNTWIWKTALIVEVGAYWAVPAFLMLTGANLIGYKEKYDTKTFFKKRFSKAVVPFLAWSCIVLVWKLQTGQYALESNSVQEVINILLNHKMENIYWYFPVLFSFYLIMPLLSCLSEPKYRHILKYLILVMFIFQSTIMPLCKLIGIDWNSKFALPVDSYLIFVLLGYYLSTANISKSTRYKLYLSGICGAVIRYSAILILSTRDGTKNTLFFNYGYFPSIMLACAVFVLMKSLNWEKILERLHIRPAMVTKISSYSLGIYLIHRIVMYYELLVLGKFGYTNAWVGWRTFAILGTYLIALVIVAVIKRIPFLNKIIP